MLDGEWNPGLNDLSTYQIIAPIVLAKGVSAANPGGLATSTVEDATADFKSLLHVTEGMDGLPEALVGARIRITSGAGAGQVRTITGLEIDAETGLKKKTVLTVDSAWNVPINESTYEIIVPFMVEVGSAEAGATPTILDYDRFVVDSNTIRFIDENGNPEAITTSIAVKYTYLRQGYNGLSDRVMVTIADSDAPGVLITQTNGSTDVIETQTTQEATPFIDTYDVVLTTRPEADVKVAVTPRATPTSLVALPGLVQVAVSSVAPGAVQNADGTVTLTFTTENWNIVQTVTVAAVDDPVVDGSDWQVFAPELDVLTNIQGPLFITGAGGSGSLVGLGRPTMLANETNNKISIGNVVSAYGSTITVNKAEVLQFAEGVTTLDDLFGRTIAITDGPGSDQVQPFRLIKSYVENGDNVILTLDSSWVTEENQSLPDTDSRYNITEESMNFFVDETTMVDYLVVNNTDSVADDTGSLQDASLPGFEQRITGLGMGPDTYIGGRLQPGGITYGGIETTLINLGSGNDTFAVTSTPPTERPYQTFQTQTILNTGAGDDAVTIALDSSDGAFTVNAGLGNDTVNGTASTRSLVIFGGEGADQISGGAADDIIFGDRGRVDYIHEKVILSGSIAGTPAGLVLTDSTADFTRYGAVTGYLVRVTGVDGTVQTRKIVSSSSTALTLDRAWETFPISGTCQYEIIDGNIHETGEVVTRLGSDPIVESGITRDTTLLNAYVGPAGGAIYGYIASSSLVNASTISVGAAVFPTENDGLKGLRVWITSGPGAGQSRLIKSNTGTTLVLDRPLVVEEDTTGKQSRFYVAAFPQDQTDGVLREPSLILAVNPEIGGSDTIYGYSGSDRIFGGAGGDTIYGGESETSADGDDVIFGDLGQIKYELDLSGKAGETVVDIMNTTYDDQGGADTIYGSGGNDTILGGASDDTINGNRGSDRILGDSGVLDFVQLPGVTNGSVLTSFETTHPEIGGADVISGNEGADTILGGASGDTLYGDDATASAGTADTDDILIGDQAYFNYAHSEDIDRSTLDFITTIDTGFGGVDTIAGDSGNDLIIGGAEGDTISGSNDADIAFGDYAEVTLVNNNFQTIRVIENAKGGADTIYGNTGDDLLVGGAAGDNIDGDENQDFIIGDNVRIDLRTVTTDPRYRTLSGSTIYDADGNPEVTADEQLKPVTQPAWAAWQITLLDNTSADQAAALNNIGEDYIAGGAGDDTIFGQLGNDIIQGDGSIDSKVSGGTPVGASRINGTLTVNASFEASTDGDDYIEGNGGS